MALSSLVQLLSLAAIALAFGGPPADKPTPEVLAFVQARREAWPQAASIEDQVRPDSENAAMRLAWLERQLDPKVRRHANWIQPDRFETRADKPDEITTELVRTELIEAQPWVAQVIAAAKLTRFELDRDDDPRMQIPDRSDPRRTVVGDTCFRVLRADMLRLADDGNLPAAMDRATAVLRIVQMRSNSETDFILSLTACGILSGSLPSIEAVLTQHADDLRPSDLAGFREAVRRLDKRDPLGVQRSWRANAESMIRFAKSQMQDGRVGLDLQIMLAQANFMRGKEQQLVDTATTSRPRALPPLPAVDPAAFPAMEKSLLDASAGELHDRVANGLVRAEQIMRLVEQTGLENMTPDQLSAINDEMSLDESGVLMLTLMDIGSLRQWVEQSRLLLEKYRGAIPSPPPN